MRKRIFDIIQIGNKEDAPSTIFDIFIVIVILSNILAMFLRTFEPLSFLFPFLGVVETVTMIIFIIEYVLRIVTADYLYPNASPMKARIQYLISFDGIICLLTILPFFFLSGFVAFRILRVVRIFHLFRINSQYDSFHIIGVVIKDKWKQIGSSLIIIFILMLSSSLGIYHLEHEAQPQAYPNAFAGMWWSVSAILTVGYGDVFPITVGGQILAIFVALLGVGVVAIPTGIISAGFVEQITLKQHSDEKFTDVSAIGEVLVDKQHPFCNKSLQEILPNHNIRILLVLRKDLHIIPTQTLIIQEGDLLVVESSQLDKLSAKSL